MDFRDLKIVGNLKRGSQDKLSRKSTHQERKRLEATLIKQANEVLKGRVTVACFEVSEYELGTMIEVVNSKGIRDRFVVQQTEIPTQFLISNRDLQIF